MAKSKKTFEVGSLEVRVRSAPSLQSETVKYLPPGHTLKADADSRTEKDGYVWWKHADGWSAERSTDSTQIFLTPSKESAPAKKEKAGEEKTFQAGSVPVRVRSAPSLQGESLKYLSAGQTIKVDAASRTEKDGYVWWEHAEGWSAERNTDGTEVFLIASQESAPAVSKPPAKPSAPAVSKPPAKPSTPEASKPPAKKEKAAEKKTFQVGNVPVRVRSAPSLQGESLKYIAAGQTLKVDAGSRTEKDGYVWWEHAEGWSAECSTNGKETYLFAPGKAVSAPAAPSAPPPASASSVGGQDLPMRDALFKRMPVDFDKTVWWQYYGNNVFAHKIWREGKRWYAYAQGLHSGLDFGNSSARGVLIYAGLEGTFFKHDTQYTKPNGLWVKVGDYLVIYGHVANPRSFQVGQPIGVDTVMGEIEFGGQQHLHLEIRYKGTSIVNPLLLMPEDMRNSLIQKFPPSGEYFYRGGGWSKWQTPLDQPVLQMGGPPIGPVAM